MTSLEKVANMTPMDLFQLSAAGGVGSFAATKLLQEMMAKFNPPAGIDPNSQLNIDIPEKRKEHFPVAPLHEHMKVGEGESWVNQPIDRLSTGAAGLLGLPAGFLGSQALYDLYKSHQMSTQLDQEKKKYQEALYKAKYGEETPVADEFCQQLADELNKEAGGQVSLPELLSQQGFGSPVQAFRNMTGSVGDATIDGGKLLFGGVSLATLAALIAKRNSKDKHEAAQQYPSRVILNQ